LPVPNGTASCFIGRPTGLLAGSDGLVLCGASDGLVLCGGGELVVVVVGCGGVDGCAAGGCLAPPQEIASTETATSAATGVAHPAMRRRIFLAGKDIWDQNVVMMIIPN
jgi:hypothetical protein